MNWDADENYPVVTYWSSMDDLPDIDPSQRFMFSALLAEILCPE